METKIVEVIAQSFEKKKQWIEKIYRPFGWSEQEYLSRIRKKDLKFEKEY